MTTDIPEQEVTGKAYDARLVMRLAGLLKPYATQLALSMLLLMAISLLQLAGPYLVKVAVDSYILPGRPEGLSSIVALYIGILFFTFCLQYIQFYATQRCGQKIMYDVRIRLFAHLQRMPLSFFDHTPAGQVVTSIVNDVEALNEILTQAIVETAGDVLVLVEHRNRHVVSGRETRIHRIDRACPRACCDEIIRGQGEKGLQEH